MHSWVQHNQYGDESVACITAQANNAVSSAICAPVTMQHKLLCAGMLVHTHALQASGFGQLKEGYLINSNTLYARRLLSTPSCPILASLEAHLKQFEIAVGLNGRIWVNSPSISRTVIACNAIQRAEFMSKSQTELLVSKLVDVAKSS